MTCGMFLPLGRSGPTNILGDLAACMKEADGAANGKGAIHGRIDKAQHAKSQVDRHAGQGITQTLPDVDIAEGHEYSDGDNQQRAAQLKTARGARIARV